MTEEMMNLRSSWRRSPTPTSCAKRLLASRAADGDRSRHADRCRYSEKERVPPGAGVTATATVTGRRGWHGGAAHPQAAQGQLLPRLLEPRRLAEKALTAVIHEANLPGISTRPVDALVKAMGMSGISKQPGKPAVRGDRRQRVKAFLDRPIEGDWPYHVDRRDLREGAPGRPHRLRRRHRGGRRQRRWPPRGARHGYRPHPRPRPSGQPSSEGSGAACAA